MSEAIVSVRASVALAPKDVEARMNLGIFLMDAGEPELAKEQFRAVLDLDPTVLAAHGNLASICEDQGAFPEAEASIRSLLAADPNDVAALRLLARVQRKTKQREAEVRTAKRLIELQPDDAALREALGRAYFLWFDSVDRDPVVAKTVVTEWVAFSPNDPVALHMMAAHGGTAAPARASDAYVEHHFDEFAASFDDVLAGLGYRAPAQIVAALERIFPSRTHALVIADLGCGTGLLGKLVKPWAKKLVGVDLSGEMLNRARALGVYDELVKGDLSSFLQARAGVFDVVLAADTFVYFGDLSPSFTAVARALKDHGIFVASFEELEEDDAASGHALHRAGRYAHKRSYLSKRLAAAPLEELSLERKEFRMELGKPVRGLLAVAKNTNDEFG